MTTYVVEVRLEDMDGNVDDTQILYGPFRSQERALSFAGKVGAQSGLNRNNWGQWFGTDGGDLIASVRARPVQRVDAENITDAILSIKGWFANSEDPTPTKREEESE